MAASRVILQDKMLYGEFIYVLFEATYFEYPRLLPIISDIKTGIRVKTYRLLVRMSLFVAEFGEACLRR